MMPSNNPTAVSAVVGQKLEFGSGPGRIAALLKNLTMPVILAAFATYLLVGIFTMKVPEGTAFPGPQFFPGLITAGLYLFAILLAVAALRTRGAGASTADAEAELDAAIAAEEGELASRTVRVDVKSLAWLVLPFLGFALLLNFLGWIIGAAALFWCVARGFGERRWLLSAIVALTVSSLTYIAFDMALGLSLPSGVLGWGF